MRVKRLIHDISGQSSRAYFRMRTRDQRAFTDITLRLHMHRESTSDGVFVIWCLGISPDFITQQHFGQISRYCIANVHMSYKCLMSSLVLLVAMLWKGLFLCNAIIVKYIICSGGCLILTLLINPRLR